MSGTPSEAGVMMGADELRKAAETLRERANAVTTRDPAPWYFHDKWLAVMAADDLATFFDEDMPASLGQYIATMHPGVGMALAGLMEGHARQCGIIRTEPSPDWLGLARLINGGAE